VDQSLDLLDGYGTPLTPASLVPRKKSEKPA
jgi:hypothetical protein